MTVSHAPSGNKPTVSPPSEMSAYKYLLTLKDFRKLAGVVQTERPPRLRRDIRKEINSSFDRKQFDNFSKGRVSTTSFG